MVGPPPRLFHIRKNIVIRRAARTARTIFVVLFIYIFDGFLITVRGLI